MSKRAFGQLALMFGSFSGRVAACFDAPPGLTRRGKTISKICFPKTSRSSKSLIKIGPRTTINIAHLAKIGKNPPHLVKYQTVAKGTAQAEVFPKMSTTRGKVPSKSQALAPWSAPKKRKKAKKKRKKAKKKK